MLNFVQTFSFSFFSNNVLKKVKKVFNVLSFHIEEKNKGCQNRINFAENWNPSEPMDSLRNLRFFLKAYGHSITMIISLSISFNNTKNNQYFTFSLNFIANLQADVLYYPIGLFVLIFNPLF